MLLQFLHLDPGLRKGEALAAVQAVIARQDEGDGDRDREEGKAAAVNISMAIMSEAMGQFVVLARASAVTFRPQQLFRQQ